MYNHTPGSSYKFPIWYRGWRIYLVTDAIDGFEFTYEYNDFDINNSNDDRYGFAKSEIEAKDKINEYIRDYMK